jgi:hypothetical protein
VFAVALLFIWLVYGYFVWGSQAPARYAADYIFPTLPLAHDHPLIGLVIAPIDVALIALPLTRPLGEALLGLLLAIGRVATGDYAYFLGRLTAKGSWRYFPALYLFKEPIQLHLLTLIAVALSIRAVAAAARRHLPIGERFGAWIHANFAEFAAILFVAVYWATAIRSSLNIGVRHVLPTFCFIYLLVSRAIADWMRAGGASVKFFAVASIMASLVIGTATSFPYFLPYYNLLAGGTKQGWKIAIDSNYDWGQDLLRLRDYVAENHIDKLSLDYFGRADPLYYFGSKLVMERAVAGDPPHGWFAISASNRQLAFAEPEPGFETGWKGVYEMLRNYQPIGQVGYSIFIYRLP